MTRLVQTPILISEPGEKGRRLIDAANVSCSWHINSVGTLSCVLPSESLRSIGRKSVRGWWVYFDAGTPGTWGGVVSSETWDNAYLELGCESFHVLLRKRLSARSNLSPVGTAGSHFRRIVNDSRREGRLPLYLGRVDDAPPLFRLRSSREDIFSSVIPKLIDGSGGQEWMVDAERNASWCYRYGRDKSSTVELFDGLDLVNVSFTDDTQPVINRIVGIGEEPVDPFKSRWIKTVEDAASILTYGVQEEVVQVQGVYHASLLFGPLTRELLGRTDPRGTITTEWLERGVSFSKVRSGDSIMMSLPRANTRAKVRVLARSYDAATRRMRLSCDVEAVLE